MPGHKSIDAALIRPGCQDLDRVQQTPYCCAVLQGFQKDLAMRLNLVVQSVEPIYSNRAGTCPLLRLSLALICNMKSFDRTHVINAFSSTLVHYRHK
ncbi:unnamed protein product [Protopolystoma xenopodis]|uniref:Uncharacterized protein n=1 Tax=Protopolystoma xenopodis TaxID=117903 RepID=A0A3S5B9M9_9PLAT|nr:unnamed protein product [Protopolystoma xenopodis]